MVSSYTALRTRMISRYPLTGTSIKEDGLHLFFSTGLSELFLSNEDKQEYGLHWIEGKEGKEAICQLKEGVLLNVRSMPTTYNAFRYRLLREHIAILKEHQYTNCTPAQIASAVGGEIVSQQGYAGQSAVYDTLTIMLDVESQKRLLHNNAYIRSNKDAQKVMIVFQRKGTIKQANIDARMLDILSSWIYALTEGTKDEVKQCKLAWDEQYSMIVTSESIEKGMANWERV